jgi:hypothetical protein
VLKTGVLKLLIVREILFHVQNMQDVHVKLNPVLSTGRKLFSTSKLALNLKKKLVN